MKASFLQKVLSSVVDNSTSYELLHFNNDRWVLNRFSKRSVVAAGYQADLKYVLQDVGETPRRSSSNIRSSYFLVNCSSRLVDFSASQWHHWAEDSLTKSGQILGISRGVTVD